MNPSQQNATDQTANFFWLLVILTGAVLITWWLEKEIIVKIVFFVRHYEMYLIQAILSGVNTLASWLSLPTIDTTKLNFWQNFIATQQANSADITFKQVAALSDNVGVFLRYPVMVVLIGLGVWMFLYNKTMRFRHNYNMQTLKKFEVENWPQITPVVDVDLLKKDVDQGPWAMAKLPIDFCKENNLLELTESAEGKKIWALKNGPAERLFVLQMGPLWQGVQALPIHMKALVVMFVARAHRDFKVTDELILQISKSAELGQLDFTGVEELLLKYQDSKVISWLEKRHAYVGTMMASLLQMARVEGVLATAEFLWLKPVDRRLWYLLNNVGRQTAVVEVAGLFAHWLAEKRLQRGLRTPMVKEAVVALEADIRDILYIPDEDKWRTSLAA
jgi:intracellular multiplication protein IcmP